jgi:DNA transformation protein and related proteins
MADVADIALPSRVMQLLSGMGTLRQRRMFGGVYIYCDDLFIATVHNDTLYFKANAITAPDFIARGLAIFSYPKEGGVARLQYYQAPPEVLSDTAAMRLWADKALLAARQDAAMKAGKAASAAKKSTASNLKVSKRSSLKKVARPV